VSLPRRWVVAALAEAALAALPVGCTRGEEPTARPLPSASPSTEGIALAGLSPGDRLAAATALCAERAPCEQARARALLAAAADEREREALRNAASPALCARAEAALRERLRPAKVNAEGPGHRTLRIVSEHCDGFLLERFIDSTEGRTARALGFDRVKCQHGGAILEAALDG